jgi:hypothetical protein
MQMCKLEQKMFVKLSSDIAKNTLQRNIAFLKKRKCFVFSLFLFLVFGVHSGKRRLLGFDNDQLYFLGLSNDE